LVSWNNLRTPISATPKAALAIVAAIVCAEIVLVIVWAVVVFLDGPTLD
jgi:hypothetical protein